MNILFLDDDKRRADKFFEKICPNSAIWTQTVETTILMLSKFDPWDFVYLDHDLGGEQLVNSNRKDCGMEVVRWIIENRPHIKKIIVHSWNNIAAEEMVAKLKDAGYNTEYKPFGLW